MHIIVNEETRKRFTPTTREGAVVLEAARTLFGCSFDEVRPRFPEIRFMGEEEGLLFERKRDLTAWEARLAEFVAEENRPAFEAERAALDAKKAAAAVVTVNVSLI
jgi:hypothetical protein